MKILIIEDDQALAKLIKVGLEAEQFNIDIAYDGKTALNNTFVNKYHLILLDLNLPDFDGTEILEKLRTNGDKTPVIIISARNNVKSKLEGLNLGADDYLVKPFAFDELLSRIKAVNRRFFGQGSNLITVGQFTINYELHIATYYGQTLALSSKEFAILHFIALSYPKIVTTSDIIEYVYDDDLDPFSSVVRVHLANLRKKVNQKQSQQLLKTIKGRGYTL